MRGSMYSELTLSWCGVKISKISNFLNLLFKYVLMSDFSLIKSAYIVPTQNIRAHHAIPSQGNCCHHSAFALASIVALIVNAPPLVIGDGANLKSFLNIPHSCPDSSRSNKGFVQQKGC